MEIYDVRINGHENPVGYLLDEIVCSWKVKSAKGKRTSSASIDVASDAGFNDIIETFSGRLDSLGKKLKIALKPRTRYYFRVAVKDNARETGVSGTHFFETGKLGEEWEAGWIGVESGFEAHPEFRKSFSLREKVRSARLYITGLGLFEAYINGEKAGDDVLAPFINDYENAVQYCVYDVTGMLGEENEIRVFLGNGWYKGRFGLSPGGENGAEFLLLAELRVELESGAAVTIATDGSWEYRKSVYELTDIYDGERQNYLADAGPWRNASEKRPGIRLTERYSPPVLEMEKLEVKEMITTPKSETVLDFGQNFAGIVEWNGACAAGETLTLEFGEILQNGNFYHDNYRSAISKFEYVSDGKKRPVKAHFTFFGFRYVKVSGITGVDLRDFTGRPVYSQMRETGSFKTGNEKINKLVRNTLWGMKSNFLDMPTDCPQRDERLGWTGDAQVFCRTAGFLMDTRAFYMKFLRDLRSDQKRKKGRVAHYLPNPSMESASVWGDVATFMPMMLYDYYGDKHALGKNYPLMRDWVAYIRREATKNGDEHLYNFGFQFGDWVALDGATEQSVFGRTDAYFIASCYYYASAKYVEKAAEILGRAKDAAEYGSLASGIYDAIIHEYFTPSGRLAIDTQTGYLVALRFGIFTDKDKLIEGLKNRIKKDCYRIKGGFVGATMMNNVLCDNGMKDLAYDFLFFEKYPGWLYEVNLGATTIWERWNSVLPDGSISGTSMNSLNHYSFGSVVESLFRHAAGLRPDAPGFRRVVIEAKPDARFGGVDCTYESASGKYGVKWDINDDGTVSLHIEVPFDCEAEVRFPDSDIAPKVVKTGFHSFYYTPSVDYGARFDENTRIETILASEGASKALYEEFPELTRVGHMLTDNIEMLAMSLLDTKDRLLSIMGGDPARFDRLVEKLKSVR